MPFLSQTIHHLRIVVDSDIKFTHGTGAANELQVHFFALLDPAFGNSEGLYITLGSPVGSWGDGPLIPVYLIR